MPNITAKKTRLEQAGWKEITAAELLGMSPEEEAVVETSLVLSRMVRETRQAKGWTQLELAERLGKKQPHVTRLETGERISFEAQFFALFAMGVQPRDIAEKLTSVTLNKAAETTT